VKITSSRFETASYFLDDAPGKPGPDVVFMGRSNVGKSSLINKLLGTKGLARTSSQPGRTQSVNFYRVNEAFYFVDLPGYGYARVPKEVQRTWGPMIEGVLDRRSGRIALALLVVDARHRPTTRDETMREWLEERNLNYRIIATKTDKLSGNGRARSVKLLKSAFGGTTRQPLLVSSATGSGMKELWKDLDRALSDKAAELAGAI
jgi:GTP-binding protein